MEKISQSEINQKKYQNVLDSIAKQYVSKDVDPRARTTSHVKSLEICNTLFIKEIEEYEYIYRNIKTFLKKNGNFCLDLWCGGMETGNLTKSFFEIENYIGVDAFPLEKLISKETCVDDGVYFIQADMLEILQSLEDNSVPFLMMNYIDVHTIGATNHWDTQTSKIYLEKLAQEGRRVLMPGWYLMTLGISTVFMPDMQIIMKSYYDGYDHPFTRKPIWDENPLQVLKDVISSIVSWVTKR